MNSLWAELSATKVVNIRHLWQVIESDFVPEFNPFTFYLNRLPPWNGRDDYLLELSLSVNVKGGVEEQLPFEVQSIMSPRDVPFNYEGIYSQAYALYRQGFHYWFSQQEKLCVRVPICTR